MDDMPVGIDVEKIKTIDLYSLRIFLQKESRKD